MRELQQPGIATNVIILDFGTVVSAGSGVHLLITANFTLRDVPASVREASLGQVVAELQYGSEPSKVVAQGPEVVVQEPDLAIPEFVSAPGNFPRYFK